MISRLVAGERIDWIGGGWLVAVSGLVLLLCPGFPAPTTRPR